MRMDMTLPGDQIATMIMDQGAGKLYLIDHKLRTAEVAEMSQFASEQLGAGGMLVNPEMAALDWDAFLKEVKGSAGMKTRELGARSVSGQSCRGLELSSTMGALTDAEEISAVPELPALIDPKSKWKGTMWLAEGLPVPVKFTSEMLGLSCIWQLLEVSNWSGSPAFLDVPPGYKVKPLDWQALGAPAKDE